MMDYENDEMIEAGSCTAFTVDIGQSTHQSTPQSCVPPCLILHQNNHHVSSKEELERKQIQADQRRKDYERARLDRIRERSEECHKIDAKVQILLAQDAKRRGLPGTEQIKPMSTRQAVMSIKSLTKDFSKLTPGLEICNSIVLDDS